MQVTHASATCDWLPGLQALSFHTAAELEHHTLFLEVLLQQQLSPFGARAQKRAHKVQNERK